MFCDVINIGRNNEELMNLSAILLVSYKLNVLLKSDIRQKIHRTMEYMEDTRIKKCSNINTIRCRGQKA